MKIIGERKESVPAFANIETVKAAQLAKKNQREADLYPRDGSRELFQLEKDVADLLGIPRNKLLLYNTGMSAVVDALELVRPSYGTKILRGEQHYSQAGNYIIDELRTRGSAVYQVNPGSTQDIERVLKTKRPEIVFFETVTNGSEMAVLNLESFLELPVLRELNPLIILDNTLPTSTGVPLGKVMAGSGLRIIGVESGTKYIGLNGEMCGMAYTYDDDLLLNLRKRRQRTGSLLSASAVETIRDYMPRSVADYHLRNRVIFQHTLRLAKACLESAGEGDSFNIIHPNFLNHPDNQQANSQCPDGISPVFFIQPDLRERHYEIAEALWRHSVISALCDLGQSFGFDRTRIWPDDNNPVVRVSGGIYSEEQQIALDKAYYEVLSAMR